MLIWGKRKYVYFVISFIPFCLFGKCTVRGTLCVYICCVYFYCFSYKMNLWHEIVRVNIKWFFITSFFRHFFCCCCCSAVCVWRVFFPCFSSLPHSLLFQLNWKGTHNILMKAWTMNEVKIGWGGVVEIGFGEAITWG